MPGGYYPSSKSKIIDVYFEILAEGRQICIVGEEYVEVTQGRPFGFEVECVTIDGEPTQGLCSNLMFFMFSSLSLPRNYWETCSSPRALFLLVSVTCSFVGL